MNWPEAFEKRIREDLGAEAASFFQALQEPSITSIRVNSSKWPEPPAHLTAVDWAKDGYYLPERPLFTADPLFHAGAYYVQEASSMWIEQALTSWVDSSEPLLALDLCAAPGGKSTHLLELLPKGSLLVSNEVVKSRSHILTENLSKWGNAHSVVTRNYPADFQKLPLSFDLILVDAPCSGEGLFRKDAEAVKHWGEQACAICAGRQEEILEDILPLLKEDGLLLYSTCTYNPDENEARVEHLASEYALEILQLESFSGLKPKRSGNQVMGYQCYPHLVKGEGFFFAGLRKKHSDRRPKAKSKSSVFSALTKDQEKLLAPQLKEGTGLDFFAKSNSIHLFPSPWKSEINQLQEHLFVLQAGTPVGEFIQKKFIPDPAWALSTALRKDAMPMVALDVEQALLYLAKAEVDWPASAQGWVLVTCQGLGLGWMKRMGNRVNNYWPSYWKIRMKPEELLGAHRFPFLF